VLSLALGPLLGASALFLMLVMFPASSQAFYLSSWLLFNLLIAGRYFLKKYSLGKIYKRIFMVLSGRYGIVKLSLALIILFLLPPLYASLRQISEHDTFEYMILGRNIYENRQISFSDFRFLPNGFFYVALHGFIYPLLYSWQLIFTPESDLVFKSLSLFYSILLFFYYLLNLRRLPRTWWMPSSILLIFTYGIIFSSLQFHLEAIRLFLLSGSVLVAVDYLRRQRPSPDLLGILLGLLAGLHFIGFVATALIIAGVFLFNPLSLKERFWVTLRLCLFALMLGFVQYLLEWIYNPFWWIQSLAL